MEIGGSVTPDFTLDTLEEIRRYAETYPWLAAEWPGGAPTGGRLEIHFMETVAKYEYGGQEPRRVGDYEQDIEANKQRVRDLLGENIEITDEDETSLTVKSTAFPWGDS